MRRFGVLAISHGSRDAKWTQLVREACAAAVLPVTASREPIPLECAFLELVEGALIQDGIDRLEEQQVTDILVVPLFISSGSTHMDEIAWALGVKSEPQLPTDLARYRTRAQIHLCDPIDDDPEIAQLLADKLKPITMNPAQEVVLLIGHGSKEQGFHERWRHGLESLAQQVKAIGGYAEADTVMLLPDEVPEKLSWWSQNRQDLAILIAPLFLSQGYFTNQVIPKRLDGYTYRYTGATLLPSPHITAWIERRVHQECEKNIEE